MPEQDPLAQLRDIHLPETIGLWPPAPGWWLLAVLLFALLCYGYLKLRRRQQRNRYRRLALAELNALSKTVSGSQYLQQVNQLLKKTALAAQPSLPVAGLTGQRWLAFLDATGNTTDFTQGAGQVLATGPYSNLDVSNPDAVDDIHRATLQQLCQRWIKQHKVTPERTDHLQGTAASSASALSTLTAPTAALSTPALSATPKLKAGVH